MKKHIIKAFVLAALLSANACKNALDEDPKDFISADQMGTSTEKDAELWVNGALSTINGGSMFQHGTFPNILELDADHVTGPSWAMATFPSGNFQGDMSAVDAMWNGPYTLIHRCNVAISKVQAMTKLDEKVRNNALGQLYFLKGWAYFLLVRAYGGVPIFKKAVSEGESVQQPRASVQEVYDYVIENLTLAENTLYSVKNANYKMGRISKGAASSLLAKTYLTMASGALAGAQVTVMGGPVTKEEDGVKINVTKPIPITHTKRVVAGHENMDAAHYFRLARDKAKEVMNSGDYTLFSTYEDVWKLANRNKGEHIWSLQSLNGDPTYGTSISYVYIGKLVGSGQHGRFFGCRSHWGELFEKTDKRITLGALKEDSYYLRKFEAVTDRTIDRTDFSFPFLRYADVLMVFAEAENELNGGPTSDAYKAINDIRIRNSASTISGLNQQEFRSFVLEERGRELALEGNRRWDLLRWGIYTQVMTAVDTDEKQVVKRRQDKHLLYPLPVNEINANKFINENNPGW